MTKLFFLFALMSLALVLCGCQDTKAHCKAQTQIDYNACVVALS